MKVLADTSVIIDYLRQKDKEQTIFTLLALSNFDIYISIITLAELYSGKSILEKAGARKILEEILSGLTTIIPLSQQISIKAGQIKARYNSSLFDAIVAATAIIENIPLATLNTKDFEKIEEISIHKTIRE